MDKFKQNLEKMQKILNTTDTSEKGLGCVKAKEDGRFGMCSECPLFDCENLRERINVYLRKRKVCKKCGQEIKED